MEPEQARGTGRGVAQARAADSFFADRGADPTALRVCIGTSCRMAGGAAALEANARASVAALHENARASGAALHENARASGAALHENARAGVARAIHCAGYCDRSPVALRPDGQAVDARDPTRELEASPEIRARARVPVASARAARGDHSELALARSAGAWQAWARALEGSPESVLRAVEGSGQRGRGGGGHPTGAKWRVAAVQPGPVKYAIANGDEGDPGSFADRVLLERDPHAVLEGLALCGFAIGARTGIVYVRSEYPRAAARVTTAVEQARAAGLLGARVLGTDVDFEVRVAHGEGSYVCGEETALIAALEGERGEVRVRPPYPAVSGLFGRPTVVNNVETLAAVPWIVAHGPASYRALGTSASRGTKLVSLNAGFARPGLCEVEFGASLRELIEAEAGGARGGARLAAVAIGGPMGSVLLPDEWDVPLCYAACAERGIELGHAGIIALPEGSDWRALARDWLRFMADESCGKCVPCRVGSERALELASAAQRDAPRLLALLDTIEQTSLCGFGQGIPAPVRRILLALDRDFAPERAR